MAIFSKVIECGTMSAAAKELDMSPPAISQYISQLEKELKVALIYRSTRKISLSEAGSRYYQQCKKMLIAAEATDDVINEYKSSVL
jgi:DNA-binding transcriptional LysR family regulator